MVGLVAPEGRIAEALSVVGEKQTRKSIKKYFPMGGLMSQGQGNPITLHSVNENIFACLWSYMAEVMVVDGDLPRSTKEAIALLVSEKNECPMCCSAHKMMGAAAEHAEKWSIKDPVKKKHKHEVHTQAMDYAEMLILETIKINPHKSPEEPINMDDASNAHLLYDKLTEKAKTEAALVVLLFFHMNRIISAVLGEQMSRAMFSVPEGAAKKIEAPAVLNIMNKLMAPLLSGSMKSKRKPGITAGLFTHGSSALNHMPKHLQGATLAGEERSNALERLVVWTNSYQLHLMTNNVVPLQVIELLDNPSKGPPPGLRPSKVAQWATVDMRRMIRESFPNDERSQDIANVLCLVSYTPQSVYKSAHWKDVVKTMGDQQAKTVVLWWSLRETIARAQGLQVPKKTHGAC
jgi:AhpD family alkylhydroperoxidase